MKKYLLACILITTGLFAHYTSTAQRASVGCVDQSIRLQAEQLRMGFLNQNWAVYRDAMLSMESRQPAPVVVHLNKGQMYQFIFVGSKASARISMEILDGEDHKIDERILKDPARGNYIVYSFVPEKTDAYLFVLKQQMKNRSMCGSFTILQQAQTQPQTTTAPAPVSPNRNTTRPQTAPTAPRQGNTTTPRR